jgi:hypothetical protein
MQGRNHHILDMYGRFNVQGQFGVDNNYLHPSSQLMKQLCNFLCIYLFCFLSIYGTFTLYSDCFIRYIYIYLPLKK